MARSLRLWLSLGLSGMVALAIAAVVAALLGVLWPRLNAEVEAKNRALGEAATAQVETFMEHARSNLERLTMDIAIQPEFDPARLRVMVDTLASADVYLEAIYVIDASDRVIEVGLPLARRVLRTDLIGADFSTRPFVASARQSQHSVWSDTYLSQRGGVVVAVALPLALQDASGVTVQAMLVGELSLQEVSRFARQISRSGNVLPIIVDRRGQIVGHPDVERSLRQENISQLPLLQSASTAQPKTAIFRLDEIDYIGTVTPIRDLGWTTLIAEPADKAFAVVRSTLLALVAGSLGAIGFAVLTAFVVSRRMSRQVVQFGNYMHAIAGGHYETHIPRSKTDEIEGLAHSMRRMAEALLERESRLQLAASVFESSVGGIMITNADKCIISVNPALLATTGFSADELVGHRPSVLRSDLQDEAFYRDMWAKIDSTGSWRGEIWNRRKNGERFPELLAITSVRGSHGNITHYIGSFFDISDQKQHEQALRDSEARFRTMIEWSPEPVLVLREGMVIYVNPAAMAMFGATSDQDLIGKSLLALVHPDFHELVLGRMRQLTAGSNSVPMIDEKFIRLDGTPIDVEVQSASIVYGGAPAIQVAMRDVTERKRAEAALELSNQRFRDLVDSTDGVVWEADASTFAFQYVSQNVERMLGYRVDEWLQPGFWASHIYSQDREYAVQYCVACTGRLENHDFEYRFVAKDGHVVWLRDIVRVVEHGGKPFALRGLMIDVSAQKLTEQRLIASQELLQDTALHKQTILDSMADGVITIDGQGVMDSFNQAACRIFGYTPQEVLGRNVSMLMPEPHHSHHDGYLQHFQKTGEERVVGRLREVQGQRKDASLFPMSLSVSKMVHSGKTTFVGLVRDITRQREDEDKIRRLGYFDPLTGLANRRLLMDRLQQAMLASTRTERHGAMMFLDLDHFKLLNDSQGHAVGDALLKLVATRLTDCVRDGDSVARLGGDEFVVLLTGLSATEHEAVTDTEDIAHKILVALGQPYHLHDFVHSTTASIGIVLFMGEHESMDELLKKADVAMYQAKAAGRNTARFFDEAMQSMALARTELEAELRQAVEQEQFVLHYQPQVVGTGRITGVEALVRWQHPVRGIVSPSVFIPVAEETDLILPIGQWVLETACQQLAAWAEQPDLAHLTIAVNVSARQFKQSSFVDSVLNTLVRTRANPKRLKLELTESMLVDDVPGIIAKMDALKAREVCFSLDDFGTGYSSLAYLKRLPLDQLKIDQGFIKSIVTDTNDAAIAKMVVALAESMGLAVIAEGVELQAQADFLAHLGCHAYQGYLFSRPLAIDALEVFAKRL